MVDMRRGAIRREPFVGEIKVQREIQAARGQLALQLIDARLDRGAFERQRQIGQAQVEQLVVAQIWPVGRDRAGHGEVCARQDSNLRPLGSKPSALSN